jgi:hypothetical protein
MTPRAIFAFLFGMADAGGAEFGPYFGIMPLLLVVVAMWRYWSNPWVKFLGVVAILAFLQGLGSYFLPHGVLYILVPYIDKLWEAGRFIYLTHFAMALLAGFGMQVLLTEETSATSSLLKQILKWTVILTAVALAVPALIRKPELDDWPYATLLFLAATWAVFGMFVWAPRRRASQIALITVILFDLYTFNFVIHNKAKVRREGSDYLAEMYSLRPVADFLKAQPGPFRVNPDADFSPINWGDVYGVQTTRGYGATMLTDYLPALFSANGHCLFNVRYFIGKGSDRSGETPAFSSGDWNVYDNPRACPRAWMVDAVIEDTPDNIRRYVRESTFDPLRVAYVSSAMPTGVNVTPSGSVEEPMDVPPEPATISYAYYQADEVQVEVQSARTGLVVLSEVYYPGWTATINGSPAPIYEVNSILRGVVVSPGSNHVVMQYRPRSVRIGALLTAFAFAGTLALSVFMFWRERTR